MRATRFSGATQRCTRASAFVLALILQLAALPTWASETKGGTPIAEPAELVLTVHPMVGKPNEPRTVFVQQMVNQDGSCGAADFTLDTSLMEIENLVVVSAQVGSGVFCAPLMSPPNARPYRFDAEIAPTKVGPLKILWKGTGIGQFTVRWQGTPSEITIQTVPPTTPSVVSKFDVNGMWFDAATNGSGIALHHRRSTTDRVFGTWFLFPTSYNGSSWLSLQSATWQQDGSVLEGLLYVVGGNCLAANLVACPGTGRFRDPPPRNQFIEAPSRARIIFQSSTRARAEVLSLGGTVLFASELTKLQF